MRLTTVKVLQYFWNFWKWLRYFLNFWSRWKWKWLSEKISRYWRFASYWCLLKCSFSHWSISEWWFSTSKWLSRFKWFSKWLSRWYSSWSESRWSLSRMISWISFKIRLAKMINDVKIEWFSAILNFFFDSWCLRLFLHCIRECFDDDNLTFSSDSYIM